MNVMEKCIAYGASELSDAEILSVLVFNSKNTKKAQGILSKYEGATLRQVLRALTEVDDGITHEQKIRALAICEVMNRPITNITKVTTPSQAGAYLMPKLSSLQQEVFGILALNAKGAIIADRILSRGLETSCLMSPRLLFGEALRLQAVSVLAYHNHPSGDPAPSPEDTNLTRRMRQAAKTLDITFVDHIIVGHSSTYSFRAAEGWDKE